MKTKTIVLTVLPAIIFAAAAAWYVQNQDSDPIDNVTYLAVGNGIQVGGGVLNADFSPDAVITRIDEGYEPTDITIRVGDTVMFKNDSESFHWPASNVHPTHSIYSDFDPREPIAPGDTWSFTFTRVGIWGFHDHIRANLIGRIVVEEEADNQ